MPYISATDLINRIGENELIRLTNFDAPSAQSINLTVLNQAIADADAIINDYLVNFLPLPAVPARLPKTACDIVRYFLYKDTPTDHVKDQYHSAIDYLRNIDFDGMGIGADATATPIIDNSNSIDIHQPTKVFSNNKLQGFMRDDGEPFALGRF